MALIGALVDCQILSRENYGVRVLATTQTLLVCTDLFSLLYIHYYCHSYEEIL